MEDHTIDGQAGQHQGVESGSDPSLVSNVQSSAWTSKQKRLFQRLISWLTLKNSQGKQLIRVDLTSGPDSTRQLLRRHFQELKRRVRRVYGYDVDSFIVETCEGKGVLHMVWAIDADKAAWIDQGWISEEWLKIHGAFRVWIKRMNTGKYDRRRVAKYMVTQYLVQQGESGSALVRYSYSWWKSPLVIGRGWNRVKREFRFAEFRYNRCVRRESGTAPPVTFADVITCWNDLLETGRGVIAGVGLTIFQREVVTTVEAAQRIFG